MADFLTYTVKPSFKELVTRFIKGREAAEKTKRDELSNLGQSAVMRLKSEAPRGKTGKFAASHGFKLTERKWTLELRFYSASPLGRFIRLGTKPHKIVAKRAKALAFFWPKVGMQTFVPRAGFPITGEAGGSFWIGKGYVNHPGTKPNPYQERALSGLSPAMQTSLNRIARSFVETVKG